jgi:hypothetical protein
MAQKFQITTNWSLNPKDWVWLEGAYAIPSPFTVWAKASDGAWAAELKVEVVGGKARTTSLTVATDDPRGVSAATIRKVPIRQIMAEGALNLLRRSVATEGDTVMFTPFMLSEVDEAAAVLETVIGYTEMSPAARKVAEERDAQ